MSVNQMKAPAPSSEARITENETFPLREIKAALRGLQFGSITVIVQDGIVVQVERTEKQRFQRGRRI